MHVSRVACGLLSGPTRNILVRPGAALQAGAGLVAQLTQGASTIGIVLVIHQHSGSVALAGAVAGALAVAAGISRPAQGRLMDRRGAAGLMIVCALLHPAALMGIVGLSLLHGPGALLLALGAVAGLALPPVSTAMRVVWGEVAAEDRTAAYSMVYLTQELALLTGPLIFAAVTAPTSASVGLVVVAAASGAGTAAFAASVRSADWRAPHPPNQRGSVVRGRGMQALLAVAILLGGVIGTIEVGIPALAIAHGTPAAAGILIALLSVGGVIGALLYGARRWAAEPAARLLWLLGAVAASVALMIASGSLPVVGLLLVVEGLAINPALTTLSLLVDSETRGPTASEAFGWLSTGISAGGGAGAAIAGALVQHGRDARPAFIAAALAAMGATGLAVVGSRVTQRGGATRSSAPSVP
jgi:predicted MFS family arabinose efflux permease